MLKKQNRLGRSDSLKQVIRRGRITRGPGFLFRTLATHPLPPRFAVSISHKAEKSAVRRNRVRRQLYGILRDHITEITPGLDCSITVQRPACIMSSADRKKTFLQLLVHAKLLAKQ